MREKEVEKASTTVGLPVAPSMQPSLAAVQIPAHGTAIDPRVIYICMLSLMIGAGAGGAAWLLLKLIALFTHLSFYGRFSFDLNVDPRATRLGPWIIGVPVIGAILVGLIARYGSRAVAGHGIPEAMEQVLTNQSRIPARMTFLKPFSAAVSIGTGGPFGAEGPIIATGGALGSLVGQLLHTTTAERKVLLAAGAAGGIAAAFGTPIAAVLLAIELLLFEFRPRSIIPAALASAVAAMVHVHFDGAGPVFPFTGGRVAAASDAAMAAYAGMGIIIGAAAVVMTRTVFWIEAAFERLPIHWMWRPAAGAVAVGVIGYFDPGILGPGYFNLRDLLGDHVVLHAAAGLCLLKFAAWTISLGSGTAGGTLAPVFTIGGALAAMLGFAAQRWFPAAGIDVRVSALMGMVAIFAGASRAFLTSVVFAFEVTHAPNCILPALCGCASAYLVSALLMRHSIMTEKMARQGVRVPVEYGADFLDTALVRDVMTPAPMVLRDEQTAREVRDWINRGSPAAGHQGYPVVNGSGFVVGVVTRRDLLNGAPPAARLKELLRRPPVLIHGDCSLREAADHMARHRIGRLPVIGRTEFGRVIGIITRGDILTAQSHR